MKKIKKYIIYIQFFFLNIKCFYVYIFNYFCTIYPIYLYTNKLKINKIFLHKKKLIKMSKKQFSTKCALKIKNKN